MQILSQLHDICLPQGACTSNNPCCNFETSFSPLHFKNIWPKKNWPNCRNALLRPGQAYGIVVL